MKPVVPLARIVHGSHLFGTSTPRSDQDFKGVHLPSGEAILLQRAEEVIDRGIVAKQGTKNTAEAVDEQSFSLQKFFAMLAKGDTVATEILFAPPLEADPRWPGIQAVGRSLLNRECKGFVGYCVRQAAKYGIAGSRMASVRRLLDLLEAETGAGRGGQRLASMADVLCSFADGQEHAAWVNSPGANGEDLWQIDCCDRKMPMTVTIGEARKVYARVWETYGERARAAAANEGIDWKAISHAVRVARQAIELLTTGHITFPRPDAAQLLAIKQGDMPYAQASILLEGLVAQVHGAGAASVLPDRTEAGDADAFLAELYLGQLV
jgi:hypothetical protein